MRSKSFTLAFGLVVITWAAWGLPACGSDDDDGAGTSGKGGSSGSSAGSGGSAGTAGSAGVPGSGGSSGTGTDGGGQPPLMCAGTMCDNPFGFACCAGTAQNKCGLSTGAFIDGGSCLEFEPGSPDPACSTSFEIEGGLGDSGMLPADSGVTADGGTITIPGCCLSSGKCGVSAGMLGCVDPSQLGGGVDAGAPRTCTPRTGGG